MGILAEQFYLCENVVAIAKALLGKVITTNFEGNVTSGIITETEAYAGITDRASHAFNGRKTKRTEVMFRRGGIAYVYLCYGIHHLFNVVTNIEGIPHAVLIRAIKPVDGIDIMLQRRKIKKPVITLTNGPGTLSAALGIKTLHSGLSLYGTQIKIENIGIIVDESRIKTSPRIGVNYAGEDAKLPYRFVLATI